MIAIKMSDRRKSRLVRSCESFVDKLVAEYRVILPQKLSLSFLYTEVGITTKINTDVKVGAKNRA